MTGIFNALPTDKSEHSHALLAQIKESLYIEVPIAERLDLIHYSLNSNDKKIVFSHGSFSGGEHGVLFRSKQNFEARVKFHLCSSRNLTPHENATQTVKQWGNASLTVSTWLNITHLIYWIEPTLINQFLKKVASYKSHEEYKKPNNLLHLNRILNWLEPKRTTIKARRRSLELWKSHEIHCAWSAEKLSKVSSKITNRWKQAGLVSGSTAHSLRFLY